MNCEECDEEIPEKRLTALRLLHKGRLPEIPLCVRCQERHDKRIEIKDVGDSLANNEWEGW